MMPPLNFSSTSSASGKLDSSGSGYSLGGSGDWNVNVGGAGTSFQGAGSTAVPQWVWLVAGLGAVWILTQK